MTCRLALEVRGKLFVLAVTDLEAIVADAVVQELVPPALLPEATPVPSPSSAPVDLWTPDGVSHPPARVGAGLAPADELQLPLGMVKELRLAGGRKWLFKVRVIADEGVLVPEALTTALENIFAKASSLKVKSLVMPGLGLRARFSAVRQVAWLTLPQSLRSLAASPTVTKFGIVLESGGAFEAYRGVIEELLQEGAWTSLKVLKAKS